MEFLRKHFGKRTSEKGRQRPDGGADGTRPAVIEERKTTSDLLKERIPHLSAVPPEEQWATITVKKEGKPTPVKVPFVADEMEAIDAAYDACLQLWNKGALNSGCERAFWINSQSFPRRDNLPHQTYPTFDDRFRAVRGIVLSAIAAREVLETYLPGKAFAPDESSRANLELVQALPEQLLEHGAEETETDVPTVIFKKEI